MSIYADHLSPTTVAFTPFPIQYQSIIGSILDIYRYILKTNIVGFMLHCPIFLKVSHFAALKFRTDLLYNMTFDYEK